MSAEVVEFFEKLRTYSDVDISHFLAQQSDQPLGLDQKLAPSFSLGEELRETIMELRACSAELLMLVKPPLTQRLEQRLEQLDQLATRIAVVGQIKAGKSSFINAIAGRPAYLPTHVNPWTAVPTKLYFGVPGKAASGAIFEFFNASEWERLGRTVTAPIGVDAIFGTDRVSSPERAIHRRAMLRIGDQFHRLLGRAHRYDTITPNDLAHYLCAGPPVHEQSRHHLPGRYADITKVAHVFLPQEPFATPTILIDTPGLNDPSFIRLKTTQHVLENADIYIVVLSASQPMSLADVTLLRRLRGLEKRRLLIFINRIDELAGGPSDVAAVEGHVRAKLEREFPEASASIISGSAHWANLALEGSASALRRSVTARPLASRLLDHPAPPPSALGEEGELEPLRMQVLEASGIPALICTLSDLMLDSFLASDGLRFVEMLRSAAEFSGTTARRELNALQQMIDQNEPGADAMSFDVAIARLEKRLTEADLIKRNIAAIIEDTTNEIRNAQLAHVQSLKEHLHAIADDFARQQKLQLLARLKEQSIRQWRCDTTILVHQLETEFIRLFTSALQQIEAIQLKCMNTVRACLEHSQVAEGEQILVAQSARQPDIRRVLSALGTTISVETSKPWWAGWWRTENSPQDKADKLEEKIIADFRPIIDSLTEQVAAEELAEFGDRASATLSDAVQSTVAGTRARLMDLKQRLYQHVQQGKLQKLELLSADYARSYKELTSLKSGCDAVIDRLQGLEARKAS